MATFSKFVRPKEPSRGVITDRDLDIIEAILRYRFSPTSELARLVGGNEDVTQRRLRRLWESGLINRWAFPGIRTHSEFHYYLDDRRSLDTLAEHGRLDQIHPAMLEELANNREKNYAQSSLEGKHMQLGFLKHQLQISRFHFMLEMASRRSNGQVELAAWHQGAHLKTKVEVPRVASRRGGGTNEYLWAETDETERLPVEPDALFSLTFPSGGQTFHFCYEADRGTMAQADMFKKLRAYYHLIKKQQKHKEAFGVHPIRAVLIETPDEPRGQKLMELASHPLVSGPQKRTGLFWFTISPLFADLDKGLEPARYLIQPEIILDPVWALPDRTLHSLTDLENAAHASRIPFCEAVPQSPAHVPREG